SAARLSMRAARRAARASAGLSTSGDETGAAIAAQASTGKISPAVPRAARTPLPCPMIRMAGENAGRAEQLLEQHRAGQQMRPGRGSESEQPIGGFALARIVAIGGADQKAGFANSVVAPVAQQLGKGFRRKLRPALIQQHSADRRLRLGNAAAALRKLRQLRSEEHTSELQSRENL